MSGEDDEHHEPEPPEPNPPEGWTRDQKLIVAGIIVAIVIGAVTVLVAAHGGSASHTESAAGRVRTTAAPTSQGRTSTQQQPPPPALSPNATCANVRATAAAVGERQPHRVFIDSPGQISGGPNTMKGRLLSNKQWTAWLRVHTGEEIELGVRLHDSAYGSVEDVSIALRIVEHADGCWRLAGQVHYTTDYGRPTRLGPLLIQLPPGQRARKLTYVPRTTRLLDEHDKELTKLPDGVLGGATTLPYSVPPGAINVYFVNFRLKVS